MVFSFLKNLFSGGSSKEETPAEENQEQVPVLADEPAAASAPRKPGSRRRRGGRGQQQRNEAAGAEERHSARPPRGGRNGRRTRPAAPQGESQEPSEPVTPPTPEEEAQLLEKLTDFALFVAKGLVSEPDKVTAELVRKENTNVIMLACEKKDTGKIIGKNGKIIASIRILVSGAAGKSGIHATVDIQD